MKLLYDFILVTGIIISVIILFVLIKAPRKELSKKILIVFFSLLLLLNLHAYACLHGLVGLYKATFLVNFGVIWFLAPFIYLYIQSIFLKDKGLVRKNFIHFLPFAICTLFIGLPINIFMLMGADSFEYLQYLDEHQIYIVSLSNVYFIGYVYLSLRRFKAYQKVMVHSHASISKQDLRWISSLLYGWLMVISIDTVTRWMDEFPISMSVNTGYFTMFSIIILIGYLGYYGMSQSKILIPDFQLEKEFKKDLVAPSVHSLSSYSEEEIASLENRLKDSMRIDKVYLDPALTLGKLAAEVGVTDKKLSTLINKHLETNFYDYVNAFRIDDVKKALDSDDTNKYTLLAIALDCGFNSKASFNRIFKKETGLSPSQFRKNNLNF